MPKNQTTTQKRARAIQAETGVNYTTALRQAREEMIQAAPAAPPWHPCEECRTPSTCEGEHTGDRCP